MSVTGNVRATKFVEDVRSIVSVSVWSVDEVGPLLGVTNTAMGSGLEVGVVSVVYLGTNYTSPIGLAGAGCIT